MKTRITASELILNEQGRVYHLNLANVHIADTVLLVGDQDRVDLISKHFDHIEYRIRHREFVTHTGSYRGKRITALSSGIGADNIDIVFNELYAATAFNIKERKPLKEGRKLTIIRIGTSGAIQEDIAIGTNVASTFGLGLDGLLAYYQYPATHDEAVLEHHVQAAISWPVGLAKPYITQADTALLQQLGAGTLHGITATATGFYGPQGRQLLRSAGAFNPLQILQTVTVGEHRITNFDMETAALYGLGRLFGFSCLTLNTIIANRATGAFSSAPKKQVEDLIAWVLHRL